MARRSCRTLDPMANTRPTPVGVTRAVWLCLLLLLAPRRFDQIEEPDNVARVGSSNSSQSEPPSSVVRRAFFASFLLVVTSGVLGYLIGLGIGSTVCATSRSIAWLQIIGACILLWGTLFVRGWEIQTYSGVVLTERVNQWLYRFLYCTGTTVLVCSLAWRQC